MSRVIDLTGMRFGRLAVLYHVPSRQAKWLCRCDCGTEKVIYGACLRNGITKSCGCLSKELAGDRARTHGMSKTVEYRCWFWAKKRCTDPTNKKWHRYGGRGIKMCDEWMDDFAAFFAHVGPRPTKKHTIDRIDVNGNYEPGNVRWATQFQQDNNKTDTIRLTWRGTTRPLQEWALVVNMPASRIKARLNLGWSVDRALSTPLLPPGAPGCQKPTLRRSVCKRGHARTTENVTSNGTCRLCTKQWQREHGASSH